MRKIIEYTLLSVDGSFENPSSWGFMKFRDEAYTHDGLGLLHACDAMLMGRGMYEASVRIWSGRTDHPWAARVNEMRKYVFSSTLEKADWNNTTIVRGGVVAEADTLKQQDGRDLLIWGHTRLAETFLKNRLIDVLHLSIHPVLVGSGKLFYREGQAANLKLVAAKAFSKIVKLSYEPQY
jgi:dihydrofolate reductase